MNKEGIFEIWSPPGGLWSDWVKPVLFSCMPDDAAVSPSPVPPLSSTNAEWLPLTTENVAVILDLPGPEGVVAALALATRGYRPVPLYNALPAPVMPVPFTDGSTSIGDVAVDVKSIIDELQRSTQALSQLDLPADAPPSFLLDANRHGAFVPAPRDFDNRSVSFTTDFPSAAFLKSHNIHGVLLVQTSGEQPQPDLAHTLRNWQETGLELKLKRLDVSGSPVPLNVARISALRGLWERVMGALELRRSPPRGFGRYLPAPGSGG